MKRRTAELARLDRKITEATHARNELQQQAKDAKTALDAANGALVEHFASEGHDPNPSKLLAELGKAKDRYGKPWSQRIAGAGRRIEQLQRERDRFLQEHYREIAEEHEPQAREAQARVERAVSEILDAHAAWHSASQVFTRLLEPVSGVNGQDLPTGNTDRVVQEARRVLAEGVRVPLPRSLFESEPVDPTIKSAA